MMNFSFGLIQLGPLKQTNNIFICVTAYLSQLTLTHL